MSEAAVVILSFTVVFLSCVVGLLKGACDNHAHDAELQRGTIEHLNRRLTQESETHKRLENHFADQVAALRADARAQGRLFSRAQRAWADERESLKYDRDLLRMRREEPRSILADFAEGEVR